MTGPRARSSTSRRGAECSESIAGNIAMRDVGGDYVLLTGEKRGCLILECFHSDAITSWEVFPTMLPRSYLQSCASNGFNRSERAMTPWEMLMAGNDEIIPIRVIDFDEDLIAEYLAPACRDSRNPSENARI